MRLNAVLFAVCLILGRVQVAGAASGSLDASFGDAGRLRAGFGANSNQGIGVVVQGDGKTVVLSDCLTGEHSELLLSRYLSDGSLDASFGFGGRVLTVFGGSASAVDIELQSDGKIFVAAYSNNGFAVARYHADGAHDTTWGAGGTATITGPLALQPTGMALQSDGKVVLAGKQHNPGGADDFAVARFTATGVSDPTFDVDGWLTTSIVGDDDATGVAIQADGRILVAGSGDNPEGLVLARYLGDGALDPSFDGDGKVFLAGSYRARDIAIQPMIVSPFYKIVVAGSINDNFALIRFTSTGLLDTTFGSNGVATTTMGTNSEAHALAVVAKSFNAFLPIATGSVIIGGERRLVVARFLPEGGSDGTFNGLGYLSTSINGYAVGYALAVTGTKAVVAGRAGSSSVDCATVRYHDNGSLDASFDGDGIRVDDASARASIARAVARQGDGKLIVAGAILGAAGDLDFGLMRCHPDGSADASFGTAGRVVTPISAGDDVIHGIALQPDGKIVVAGESVNGIDSEIAVARYNPNGTLDLGFGIGGLALPMTGPDLDGARAVSVQPDGKILVAGTIHSGSSHFAFLRFAANGTLELVVTALPPGIDNASATALVLQPDGRIVVAGASANGRTPSLFTALRLLPDGTPDPSFDADGWVRTAVGTGFSAAHAALVQPDGRIVLAGASGASGMEDFAVVRYLANGSLDAGFSGDGIAIQSATAGSDIGRALAQQPNGKILVAGVAGGANPDFAALRLQADGTLDVSYGNAGIATADFDLATTDAAWALQVDADGHAVLAGDSQGLIGMVRLLGDEETSSVGAGLEGIQLGTAWPNPTRHGIAIALHLDTPGRVTAGIFDARGRLVRSLESLQLAAGTGSLAWDGRDTAGRCRAASTGFAPRAAAKPTPAASRSCVEPGLHPGRPCPAMMYGIQKLGGSHVPAAPRGCRGSDVAADPDHGRVVAARPARRRPGHRPHHGALSAALASLGARAVTAAGTRFVRHLRSRPGDARPHTHRTRSARSARQGRLRGLRAAIGVERHPRSDPARRSAQSGGGGAGGSRPSGTVAARGCHRHRSLGSLRALHGRTRPRGSPAPASAHRIGTRLRGNRRAHRTREPGRGAHGIPTGARPARGSDGA
jgi:uncharacterized delta-60 repeat protein